MPAAHSEVSSPCMAIMNCFWSIAPISARRTAGLSNGGYRWFGRSRNGRGAPTLTMATRGSTWVWRMRSPCQATLSVPVR